MRKSFHCPCQVDCFCLSLGWGVACETIIVRGYGTTSLRYVTRKRINKEHSDRARDTSMPVECMQDF